MPLMKIRVVFLLSLFLFFSSVNANNSAFLKEIPTNTVMEFKVSVEQTADDFEVFFNFASSFTSLSSTTPDVIQVYSTNTISYYIYKPPKSSSFNS